MVFSPDHCVWLCAYVLLFKAKQNLQWNRTNRLQLSLEIGNLSVALQIDRNFKVSDAYVIFGQGICIEISRVSETNE